MGDEVKLEVVNASDELKEALFKFAVLDEKIKSMQTSYSELHKNINAEAQKRLEISAKIKQLAGQRSIALLSGNIIISYVGGNIFTSEVLK